MDPLIITSTNETPHVNFNALNGIFLFTGKSYPENVTIFYDAVINYIEQYIQSPSDETLLEFNWLYFNTATSKIIVKIIMLLKTVTQKGKMLKINWYCKSEDDLMIEKGNEFKELLEVDFNILII